MQLLAEEAVPVDTLDISAAKELLAQSQSQLASASTDGQVIITSNHFPELDGESGSGPFGAIRE